MKTVIVKGGDKEGVYLASIGDFHLTIDRSGGDGPRSIELLLVGLGTCTYENILFYMKRKELPLDDLSVELRAGTSDEGKFFDRFIVTIRVSDQLSDREKKTIFNVAETCRIHNTIKNKPDISVEVVS
jgi:uncharacterized OsmC-like protein